MEISTITTTTKRNSTARQLFSITLLVTFTMLSFSFLSSFWIKPHNTLAYETSCPVSISDEECLSFLQDQSSQIQNEQQNLENLISGENIEQQSLYYQIDYLSNQIQQTELTIAEKEIEIEKKNIEIRILGDDMLEIQNNVDTLTQEITNLESTISLRTKTSYKMSLITPLEIILDSENMESMMRRMKYLIEVKKKDKLLLIDMSISKGQLETEETILNEKRHEIQINREIIESERAELAQASQNLGSQRAQQQVLVAESERRENEYQSNIAEMKAVEDAVTAQISQLIFQMYQSGQIQANTPVNQGDIIGFQGNTGLSYGSHLHFEYRKNGVIQDVNAIGCLSVSFGSMAGAGSCIVPVDSGEVTQYPHEVYPSLWYAVDFRSTYHGDQPGSFKWGEAVSCYGGRYAIPAGLRSTRGEGAFIRAVKSGKVTQIHVDDCGGKYVIVDHGNGETSFYLHLQ